MPRPIDSPCHPMPPHAKSTRGSIVDDNLARLLDRLEAVKTSGSGYSARCPVAERHSHGDASPSLSVGEGEAGAVLVHCHGGCPTEDVVAAVGLTMADLAGAPVLVETYVYTTEDGATALYSVQRWANPKTFRCVPGLPPPAERVLYALPWVAYARTTATPLYVVEGERDVNTLLARNVPATCNPGGASKGKWLPHYSAALAGCTVIVVADNDEPGRAHARAVAASVTGHAKHVSLAVPGYGKDITEMLGSGYGLEALQPLPEAGALPALESRMVHTKAVDWAWPHYFPFGKLSTVEGDPGDGKSTLTVDLAARWSSGMALPDGASHGGPFPVLLISAEDDVEDTIVPRLRAAGAALERVFLLTSGADPTQPFDLGVDLDALETFVRERGVRVVVLDPLAAFLPDKADSHSDHSVRKSLYPLHLLAGRTGAAVIAVRHLSKSATKAIYAGNGSIGMIAAARAGFLVRVHPTDENARILAPIKCNLTAKPATLAYRITWDEANGVGRIAWEGAVDVSAQDAMDGEQGADERTARDDAADFLLQVADQPLRWQEIATRGRKEGHPEITLRRARGGALVKITTPRAMPWSDENVLPGRHWIRPDKADEYTVGTTPPITESDGGDEADGVLAHLLIDPHIEPREQMSKNSAVPAEPPDPGHAESPTYEDREAELMARPRVCDVCGNADCAMWAKPWWVVRCQAHDPRHYRHDPTATEAAETAEPAADPDSLDGVPPTECGPCGRCGRKIRRYGNYGRALCRPCQEQPL